MHRKSDFLSNIVSQLKPLIFNRIPAPQVTSFTLRKVEGSATTGGSYQGQSSYASQRSDYGGASSYASQSGFNQP